MAKTNNTTGWVIGLGAAAVLYYLYTRSQTTTQTVTTATNVATLTPSIGMPEVMPADPVAAGRSAQIHNSLLYNQ